MDNIHKIERNLLHRNQQSRHSQDSPKHIGKVRDFDMNYYEKGKNWQKNGFPLSGANNELKKNIDFIKGYNHENQLSRIVGNRKERYK